MEALCIVIITSEIKNNINQQKFQFLLNQWAQGNRIEVNNKSMTSGIPEWHTCIKL